jgi:hypothetical protein
MRFIKASGKKAFSKNTSKGERGRKVKRIILRDKAPKFQLWIFYVLWVTYRLKKFQNFISEPKTTWWPWIFLIKKIFKLWIPILIVSLILKANLKKLRIKLWIEAREKFWSLNDDTRVWTTSYCLSQWITCLNRVG